MMHCSQSPCKKEGRIALSYTSRIYCNEHFIQLIEKRIRKHIREQGEIKARQTYILPRKKDKETAITRYFLTRIFGNNITLKTKGKGKTIIPTNLDREITSFLNTYLENKPSKKQKGIPFLYNVTDEDLMHIAKSLKIRKKSEPKHQLIETIEKKHPGMKFALNKSRIYYESIRKKTH